MISFIFSLLVHFYIISRIKVLIDDYDKDQQFHNGLKIRLGCIIIMFVSNIFLLGFALAKIF